MAALCQEKKSFSSINVIAADWVLQNIFFWSGKAASFAFASCAWMPAKRPNSFLISAE